MTDPRCFRASHASYKIPADWSCHSRRIGGPAGNPAIPTSGRGRAGFPVGCSVAVGNDDGQYQIELLEFLAQARKSFNWLVQFLVKKSKIMLCIFSSPDRSRVVGAVETGKGRARSAPRPRRENFI